LSAVAESAVATRVVIAEDEAIIRLDLREILESAGFLVVGETARGDEAVTLVAAERPDLVILDIKMPGLGGIEAARAISAEHSVAIMVLTAFSQRDLIEEARDAGVHAYLVKPFRREQILPAIDRVLATWRQEQAIDEEAATLAPGSDGADDKIETRRVVEDAKAVLMDRHEMSESEAFSFIQQTAMRTRTRMRDIAQRVIEGTLGP
jgi:AmiR/NasT family two-component response regulator